MAYTRKKRAKRITHGMTNAIKRGVPQSWEGLRSRGKN
jgi:hypothetical protein